MKYLFVKMRRDFARLWTQFFSVFTMACLALFIYAGLEGTWNGMRSELSRYFARTDLASAWVYGGGVTQADLQKLERIGGVTDASPAALFSADAALPGSGSRQPQLQLSASPENRLSTPQTVSGAPYSPQGSGIWLDSAFASANGLKPGGSITLTVGGVRKTLAIRGLVMSPEYIYYTGSATDSMPNHRQYGFALIGTGTAGEIFDETVARSLQKEYLPQLESKIDSAYAAARSEADAKAEQLFGAQVSAQKSAALQTATAFADTAAEQVFTQAAAAREQAAESAAQKKADSAALQAVQAAFRAKAPAGAEIAALPGYAEALAQAKTEAEAKASAQVRAQLAAQRPALSAQLARAKAQAEQKAQQGVEQKFAAMRESLNNRLAAAKRRAEGAAQGAATQALCRKLGVSQAQLAALRQLAQLPNVASQSAEERTAISARAVSLLKQLPDSLLSRSVGGFPLSALKSEPLDYNMVRLKTASGTDSLALENRAQEILGSRYLGFADRTTFRAVAAAVQKTGQIQRMSLLFSAIFILLALLTMQTTMARLIDTQQTQIGTFKALGFRNGQIRLHYAGYGLTVGLLGGALGLIAAPFTISPALLRAQANTLYTLPAWPVRLTWASFAMLAAVALCCTLATLFACRRGLSGMPADSMRGPAPKAGRQMLLEKAPGLWNRLAFGWKWTLRDIARSKVRSVMGTVGVLGCMMLLIASFGMQYTDDGFPGFVYTKQYTYAVKAVLASGTTQRDRDALAKTAGSAQWVEEQPVEYKDAPASETGLLTVADSGGFVRMFDASGKPLALPASGVIVTQRTARVLHLKKGGVITLRPSGGAYLRAAVAGIAVTPTPQGVFASRAAWEKLGRTFSPTALLSGNPDAASRLSGLSAVQETASASGQYRSAVQNIRSFGFIFLLLKLAAILLGVVILYNLGILSFTERTREYATLKVLGFYQKEIRSLALRESLVTTFAGWLAGIPVGLWFLARYVGAVSTASLDLTPRLTLSDFLLATAVTVGCSVCVSLFLSRKVRRIDMVASLKSVE